MSVNVAFSFRKILPVSRGEEERSLKHFLDTLENDLIRVRGVPASRHCQHYAYHGQKAIQDLPFARTGAAGGGNIREVQLAGGCKHDVCVLLLLHTVQYFSSVLLFLFMLFWQFAVNRF